ncbi:MAG: hypothetical protein IJ740_14550 [Ruminococcus sp.]|nr:hypothetical protein [Ruminococcus sp.]
MTNRICKQRLSSFLDSITEGELERVNISPDGITADNEITERIKNKALQKAGFGTYAPKPVKRRSRGTAAVIALAAAAAVTITAAAVNLTASHEHTVNDIFGSGASAELAKKGILVNRAVVSDYYRFTVDLAYATDDYARVVMTFEGTDDKGRGYIERVKDFRVDMIPLDTPDERRSVLLSETGYAHTCEYNEQTGELTLDMEVKDSFKGGRDYTLIIRQGDVTDDMPLDKDTIKDIKYLASIDLKITPNIDTIKFVSRGKPDLYLCDYELMPLHNTITALLRDPNAQKYEIQDKEPVVTFIFKDSGKMTLTKEQVETGNHLKFKGLTIDSENVERIIINTTGTEYVIDEQE